MNFSRRIIVITAVAAGIIGSGGWLDAFAADAEPSAPKAVQPAKSKPAEPKPAKPNVTKPTEPTIEKLVLHPAKPPAAALEYPLLPRFIDQTQGNAATLYLKAELLLPDSKDSEKVSLKIADWLGKPPSELPRDEVRKTLASFASVFEIVRQAAHRDHCDWDPPIRETDDVFSILLPEMQRTRRIWNLLALKAHLQIAEGHFADALDTLQTGYAMARHVSDARFLVCGLVGIAITEQMDQEVEILIQSPNCPNLYWSLTALPDPIIDLRPAMSMEADSIFIEFPELRGIELARHSPAEWEAMLTRFNQRWAEKSFQWGIGDKPPGSLAVVVAATVRQMGQFAQAKTDLVASGFDRQAVEAMPAAQVILLHTTMAYEKARDDSFKWLNMPYWQAHKGMIEAGNRLKTAIRQHKIIAFASVEIPSISAARAASVRARRRIALLRTIEALRFYAADHDGKLPPTLDDIKEVPIPIDPVTGKSPIYKLHGSQATLDAPPPSGETWEWLRYEITIAAKFHPG